MMPLGEDLNDFIEASGLLKYDPNKITQIAQKFYKVPTKVTESLVIFKKIINYFAKQKYNIRTIC